jgi:hypothetical protein
MIIAQEKKKTNIIEYIIYMWQIEDIIRSLDFDTEKVKQTIVSQFQVNDATREEINIWYDGLIQQMKAEKIQNTGHLQFLINHVNDLFDLHQYLIQIKNQEYLQYYSWAKSHIEELVKLSKQTEINEIEACLNGLYGFLLLKLQKREVTQATQESIEHISKLMAALNKIYFKIENGEMEVAPKS